MTVGELILELQMYSPDALVWIEPPSEFICGTPLKVVLWDSIPPVVALDVESPESAESP